MALSKASAFFSTAHCPWRTSSVKPPNPATTSSVERVLSESIFPPRLQWNRMVTSFILSRLDYRSSLLSGPLVFSVHNLRCIQNCAARPIPKKKKKKSKTDHITLLFQFFHWLPIQHGIQYKINMHSLLWMYHGHCSVLSLWLSSTLHTFPYYPFCFWYSQPPDSSHETVYCWFPRHFCFWSTTLRLREWPSPSSPTETLSGLIQM